MTQEERKVFEVALEALEISRIFVTSREKIKHPEGTDWYDERISAIKEALAQQAVVEHDLAKAYRTELDKLSQRNYELRMENAQLKAQPKEPEQEPEWYHGIDVYGCNRFYHKTEDRTSSSTRLSTPPHHSASR